MDSLHCTLDQLVKNVPMMEMCCCKWMLKVCGDGGQEEKETKRERREEWVGGRRKGTGRGYGRIEGEEGKESGRRKEEVREYRSKNG